MCTVRFSEGAFTPRVGVCCMYVVAWHYPSATRVPARGAWHYPSATRVPLLCVCIRVFNLIHDTG